MAWFQREVLFLEAESGKIIEETFDSLIKSDLAVNSLKTLKQKKLREVIGKKYMRKIDCVIFKFSKEIEAADELFENKKDDPPVQQNLPPISGSIYWSQGIGAELKERFNLIHLGERLYGTPQLSKCRKKIPNPPKRPLKGSQL